MSNLDMKALYISNHTTFKAASFPIVNYTSNDLQSAFAAIQSHWPSSSLRVALFNATHDIRKSFLDITPEEVQSSVDTTIVGAFAFAREVILTFKKLGLDNEGGKGKRGTLLFTGATASLRGNTTTYTFAAGKFGIRALSQSLAKEFGKQNIHVGLLHTSQTPLLTFV